jgi:hypothetical protein
LIAEEQSLMKSLGLGLQQFQKQHKKMADDDEKSKTPDVRVVDLLPIVHKWLVVSIYFLCHSSPWLL